MADQAASHEAFGANTAERPAGPSRTTTHRNRKNHRGGKKTKKRLRRQSFMGLEEASTTGQPDTARMETHRPSMYSLGQGNLSSTSIDSHHLLDHRNHDTLADRRGSVPQLRRPKKKPYKPHASSEEEEDDDTTPLIRPAARSAQNSNYGGYDGTNSRDRLQSRGSSKSSRHPRHKLVRRQSSGPEVDVNNPPSRPASPFLEHSSASAVADPMVGHGYEGLGTSPATKRMAFEHGETVIDIDGEDRPRTSARHSASSISPQLGRPRRTTIQLQAAEDVCFPQDGMSDIAEVDEAEGFGDEKRPIRRHHRKRWPFLDHMEEWSQQERAYRSEEVRRSKKVSEPTLINGRLRPKDRNHGWHREENDTPYRYTYFNEEFENTIHSHTISELETEDCTFRDMFIPEPPVLDDSSSESGSEKDEDLISMTGELAPEHSQDPSLANSRAASRSVHRAPSGILSGSETPSSHNRVESDTKVPPSTLPPPAMKVDKQKKYGNRPTFWLDVLSPTEPEMRVIARTFGIHPLTSEDILVQEPREKVELFRNYYFVSYRSFEQDTTSEDYLEPVNIYVVVFREGVISFHFSQTPHPANVRRRIRQLKDYLVLSADWVSYAIIDDITDIFVPLIQSIEDEVDDVDDKILVLHTTVGQKADTRRDNSKLSQMVARVDYPGFKERGGRDKRLQSDDEKWDADEKDATKQAQASENMLRRIGDTRKKVMNLYRLMGNKADVIKGFAKRCNEQWDVAPRSEIGLYLGDIQDHIVTMSSNLSHYENILSRSQSNYLAQINIRMGERSEQTADVLGKLTVLGTIVLPMNIITGLWGMNCLVPGQGTESLYWFWSLTAGLLAFGLCCYLIAKRVYGIV